MSFERARRIADAVMLEGYVLYPYRASAGKNRYRWTFGVLAPRRWSQTSGFDPWWLQAECLAQGERGKLRGRLRFLQVERRTVEALDGGRFVPTDRLEVDGWLVLPWEEGHGSEIDFELDFARRRERLTVTFSVPGGRQVEILRDGSGTAVGRVVRTRTALHGEIQVRSEPVGDSAPPLTRLSFRVENHTPFEPLSASRAETMHAACVSTHLLLSLTDATFVSLIDPPPHARDAAAACVNRGSHPVLAGEPGRYDLMLCAPFMLYDHPAIAPESPGDFFDATEIDELLALRTLTLTDEEKALARATDPRSAALIERVEAMTPADHQRLHGAVRELSPVRPYLPGARVVLRPGKRRTDAQDLLFAGMTATVAAVLQDVDGRDCLAVTIDDDPAAELHRWYGRYHYYYPDEVEPVERAGQEAAYRARGAKA